LPRNYAYEYAQQTLVLPVVGFAVVVYHCRCSAGNFKHRQQSLATLGFQLVKGTALYYSHRKQQTTDPVLSIKWPGG